MVEIKQLSKSFEKEDAVKNIHLSVKKGTIYGLLGSNGAGKTTLLKMLAGIYKPDQGSILVKDQPVYENVQIKQRMIFIPDSLYFLSQSTIQQMADYYRHFYPHWNQERFQKLKEVFNIDLNKKVHRLSKGMQRQVAFWLAFSTMPEILILDEPIDGLDPVMRQKIKNLLFQDVAEREMTVLISSHNLREIEDICDHVGIMHKGQLLIEKEIDDLKADTQKIQIAFAKPEDEEKLLKGLKVLYQENRGSIHLYIVRGNEKEIKQVIQSIQPLVFDLLPLTLEEIFIYEMGDVGYEITNVLI